MATAFLMRWYKSSGISGASPRVEDATVKRMPEAARTDDKWDGEHIYHGP